MRNKETYKFYKKICDNKTTNLTLFQPMKKFLWFYVKDLKKERFWTDKFDFEKVNKTKNIYKTKNQEKTDVINISFGLKECKQCEYKLRCEECVYQKGYEKGYEKHIAETRKETAKEILELLVPDCKNCDKNWHRGCLCLRSKIAEKIIKKYGVDLGEENEHIKKN